MTEQTNSRELWTRRARSFGDHARAYAEHRPDYPVAAVHWGLDRATIPVHAVLDLAAGTGKLTATLVELGFDVMAVEPDPAMLAQFTELLPDVPALEGTAERIPLPDASMDAVLVGQAFHWFEFPAALDEIGRVLRAGGVLAALWNRDDDSVEWAREVNRRVRTSVGSAGRQQDLPSHPAFTELEESPSFPHSHVRTAESLVATFSTHSHMLVAEPQERAEKQRAALDFLTTNPETAGGEFEWPILTNVVRARRLA